jgi:hypothetical protein
MSGCGLSKRRGQRARSIDFPDPRHDQRDSKDRRREPK